MLFDYSDYLTNFMTLIYKYIGEDIQLQNDQVFDLVKNPHNFYIDNIKGDDTNLGAINSPVKTLNEIANRLHGKKIDNLVSIHLLTDITDSPKFSCDITDNGLIQIFGTKTLIASGSITKFQTFNKNARSKQILADSKIPSFIPYIGKRIELGLKSSNPGCYAFIYQDNKSNSAIIGSFWDPVNYQVITPQVGDQYNIYSLSKINGCIDSESKWGAFVIYDCEIDYVSGSWVNNLDVSSGTLYAIGCIIDGKDQYPVITDYGHIYIQQSSYAYFYGCWIKAHLRAFTGSEIYIGGCMFSGWGTAPTADGGGSLIYVTNQCVGYGEQSFLQARQRGEVIVGAEYISFDQSMGLSVGNGCNALIDAPVWGAGITDYGVFIAVGGRIGYSANCIPNFVNNSLGTTFPTQQVNIGGVIKNFTDLNNSTGCANTANGTYITPL